MKNTPMSEEAKFEDALSLVSIRYPAQEDFKKPAVDTVQFGQLHAFTPEEVNQLGTLQALIERYVVQRSPARPLCLAVFRASRERQILCRETTSERSRKEGPEAEVSLTLVNLTQELGFD